MKFQYYRISLTAERKEPRLPLDGDVAREELIARMFSEGKRYDFSMSKAQYVFIVSQLEGKMVIAKIGRKTERHLHDSPVYNFAEKTAEDWPNSNVFINLSDEKDSGKSAELGQVIAIQVNNDAISNPTRCLQFLAKTINENFFYENFYISIEPILEDNKGFWSEVEKHRGDIKTIVLSYVPPNILNIKNSLSEDLREHNEKFNTTRTKISLENERGNLQVPQKGTDTFLDQSVEAIERGAGNYAISLKERNIKIKSEKSVKTKSIKINLPADKISKEDLKEIITLIMEE